MTFAEWNETRFGATRDAEAARLAAAIFLLILMVCNLMFISVGTGKFAEEFLPFPRWEATLIVLAVVGVYVTLGGFFGVILTDVFQTILIGIGAVIMAFMVFAKAPAMSFIARDPGWFSLAPTWKLWPSFMATTPPAYQHFGAFGPILLAGDLGREGLTPAVRYGPSSPPVRRMTMPLVPGLVGDVRTLLASVKSVTGSPLTFRLPVKIRSGRISETEIRPDRTSAGVTLIPFYRASDIRYTAYWNLYTEDEWTAREKAAAAAESRQRGILARTIDTVDLGTPASEKAHEYDAFHATQPDFDGRLGREAAGDGWFGYTLKARPDVPLALAMACRGSEGRRRAFDILVDGQRIAAETLPYHPTELLDFEYPIPEALTRGKTTIVVKIQPQGQAATAQVFEMRTLTRQ